jgi:hypothetical protein
VLLALCSSAGATHGIQELVSTGPSGGNGAVHAAYGGNGSDGSIVFFFTAEQLVPSDTDGRVDVYQRSNGTTTLVSTGPTGGNGAFDAGFDGASSDGSKVWFRTTEQLVSSDTDTTLDVYQRSGGSTTILTQGPAGGNAARDAFWVGASQDGSKVWFVTNETLVAGDTDSNRRDVYQNAGGTTTQISLGSLSGNGPLGADFAGATPDGSRVYFTTDEALDAADTDGTNRDLYERVNGATTNLISIGPAGGSGAFGAFWGGATPDGSKVYFTTSESLVAGDTDGGCSGTSCSDVYERASGVTTLISTSATSPNGPYTADFGGVSSNGSKVFFTSDEPLDPQDTDSGCLDQLGNPTMLCRDVYERSGGSTTWVSTSPTVANSAAHANFGGVSTDGSRVFFHTNETLAATDTDAVSDVYERTAGVTSHLSIGPAGGNANHGAGFLRVSPDGTKVLFSTSEQLTANDTDGSWQDVYERSAGVTTLISTGPASPNGAHFPLFEGASSDLSKVFFTTSEPLLTSDTDSFDDVYAATIMPTNYPRPGGGSPLTVPLAQAFQPCTAGTQNSNHIAPLDLDSCAPPVRESPHLTTSGTGRAFATAKFTVLNGLPGTPADEADVTINSSITDVRKVSDGLDYDGEVILTTQIRITDRANGTAEVGAATVEDAEFSFPMDCVPNGDIAIGSACSMSSTADTLVPGFAKESKRAVISMLSVRVEDAGADGAVGTGPACPPTCGTGDESTFLRQGVFAP